MDNKKLSKEIERRELANNMAPFPVYDTDIINDLKDLEMITKKQDYNNVPIAYCKTCLKIQIKYVTFKRDENNKANVSYCVDCSNSDIGEAHVEEWEELYQERYGEKFLKDE